MEIKVTLNGPLTIFHVKQSNFQNIKWFLSYTQKCVNEGQKTAIRRNTLIPKKNIQFNM